MVADTFQIHGVKITGIHLQGKKLNLFIFIHALSNTRP